jgi:hypothetical protein
MTPSRQCVRVTLATDRRPGLAGVESVEHPGPLADLPGLLPPGASVPSTPGTKREGTGRIRS